MQNSFASKISTVVRLDLNKNDTDLFVYPNPIKGNKVSIAALDPVDGIYEIIVLNMSGQIMLAVQ